MKVEHTENQDGASSIWKAKPVTSSCPWRFGNVSPIDMQMWTWKKKSQDKPKFDKEIHN